MKDARGHGSNPHGDTSRDLKVGRARAQAFGAIGNLFAAHVLSQGHPKSGPVGLAWGSDPADRLIEVSRMQREGLSRSEARTREAQKGDAFR